MPRPKQFKAWLESQQVSRGGPILPKRPVGPAIACTLNQWDALCIYTTDGEQAIDNNARENALRSVVIGRKNLLFCGSDNGGNTAAVLFSLIATCQRHEVDPFAYLRDLLTRLAAAPLSQLDAFLPDRWKAVRSSSVPGILDVTHFPVAIQRRSGKLEVSCLRPEAHVQGTTQGLEGTVVKMIGRIGVAVMPVLLAGAAALAVPINYVDAAGNGNWSAPASWTQNSSYPGANDPVDTALVDKGTTTVDVDVPLMGMITVNNGGKILASRNLNNTNTVTINSGGQVEFDANYPSGQKYYWNMILNDGALWYGNLHQDGGMYGNFTVADSATVTIRHSGAQYNTGRLNGTIAGPATSTINFEAVSYVNDMAVSGTNSGLLSNLNIKCPLVWGTTTPLGPNGGGTVRVLANGVIRQGRAYGAGSAVLARDLTFAGGSSWNTTHPSYTITYSGQWTLQADTPLTVDTAGGNIGYVILSGRVTEDATPRKFSVAMTNTGAADGKLQMTNAANNFSGGLSVAAGNLYLTASGAQGTGPLTLTNNAEVFLDATPNANWTLGNTIGGVGAVQVEDGSTSYTLTENGGALSPGAGAAAGTLTIRGNLALTRNGSTPAAVNIDIVGAGSPMVVSNDLLAVTRNVSGLSNAVLNVSLSGVTGDDVKGRTFTILTCANDLAGQQFSGVTYTAGWVGMVTYNNGAIYLQVAPQGQAQPAMQLSATQLRLRATAASPVPAAQNVTVKNIGFGTLQWTASRRAPAPSWLTVTNGSGTDDQAFTVSVDRTGLADGTYTAWVDVTDDGAANSPQSVLVVLQALPATIVSTHSFTNSGTRGTHPGTLNTAGSTISVNLSALPGGTTVYRAMLVPHLSGNSSSNSRANTAMQIQAADAPGVWLQAAGPRYLTVDCTAAAQRAMAGTRTLQLNIISWPGWNSGGQILRLDVWCDQPPVNSPQQVTNLAAVHRTGDTMLTFTEVEQPLTTSPITGPGYDTAMNSINASTEIRYRIYRSASPIDATTIRTAELVDEISPLTCWNTNYDQQDWNTRVVPTLPVADMTQAAPGTGIYVNRAKAAGGACYAVSRVVDGEEDLSNWIQGFNTMATAVAELAGAGTALQWQQVGPVSFAGVSNATKYYFVKWECPPNYNVPSYPHNYLVAVPPTAADPRPVSVGLHEWGGSMETVFWTEAGGGSLLVATNQVPYDWWTAFHENSGTLRPFTSVEGNGGGRVRPYSENRIWSFVTDFVAGRWSVDANRILVRGGSMGGSGASMWGVRANDKFAYIVSQVGVHIPANSPTFTGSFEGSYGLLGWNCLYADTGLSAFDYWDNNQWLRSRIGEDIPFITFANGKNDSGIGWPQARLMAIACQETRRPHLFSWGQNGHLQGVIMPGLGGDLKLAKDKTLPAFTYCSLDNNPGNGSDTDGDAAGQFNAYLWWQQNDSTDTAGRWEMTSYLIGTAPAGSCTVDVTPRRCQAFRPAAGTVCIWTNADIATGTVIASGTAVVDANGLVTVPAATVSKTKDRLTITISGDVNSDGHVDVTDLLLLAASWGRTTGQTDFNAGCDFNKDGTVNVIDLLMLADNWGG